MGVQDWGAAVTIGTNPKVCDMTSLAVRTSGTNANERTAASSVSSAVGPRGPYAVAGDRLFLRAC